MSLSTTFRAMLEAEASRPQDNLENPEGVIPSATPVQEPAGGDGSGAAHENRIADSGGELGGEPSATPVQDPVGGDGQDTHALRPADQAGVLPVADPSAISEEQEEEDEEAEIEEGCEKKMYESISTEVMAAVNEGVEFKVSLGESLAPLFESQDMTPEFASQAVEIFEAAVNEVARTHVAKINESVSAIVESRINHAIDVMEAATQKYCDGVIAEWVEQNQVAIQANYRTQIAESFMDKLKALLEDHYVELPSDKVDMYEHAVSKGEELLGKLNESEVQITELQEEIAALKKEAAVNKFVAEMTMVEAERVRSLAEDLTFTESFEEKLTTLTEGLVSPRAKSSTMVVEDVSPLVEEQVIEEGVDADVKRLAGALGKFVHKA